MLTAAEVAALGAALAGNAGMVLEVWDSSIALADVNSSSSGENDKKDVSKSNLSDTDGSVDNWGDSNTLQDHFDIACKFSCISKIMYFRSV